MSLTGQKPRQKQPKPIRDKKHRQFIARLPCLACGKPGPSQCAHIRIGWYRGGQKPGDDFTVPLCPECHAKQHSMNEREFWYGGEFDMPVRAIAARLHAISGDEEKGRLIVLGARGKVT